MDIADLWTHVVAAGDRPFMIRPSGTVSYSALRAHIAKAFTTLNALGVPAGKPIAILMEDEAKASAVFVAALLRGNAPVMLPPDIGHLRLETIRRTIEAELIARDDSVFASEEPPTLDLPDLPRDGLAYLLFTSGTTAAPSGVEITRENLCSHLDTLIRLFSFDRGSRIFNPTPIAHTDGLIFGSLLPMASGGTVIRPGPMRLSEFEDWVNLAQRHHATHAMTNPTVLSLITRAATRDDYFTFEGFRGFLCGGSLLRPDLWLRFEDRFRTEIWNLYGLSETVTTALYAGRHPEMGPVGTLGRPIDCEARIAAPQDLRLSPGDGNVGELQLRGAHIFRGYWRNPERTASTFVPGGWMRTGDLVRRNDDGSFDFLGRIKAAINSGGTLIRGEEVDECLLRHPAVAEVVTVGLPDEDFEEIAVSAVVLKAACSEAELTEYCRTELETLKVPKRIFIVPAIPRGDAGKPKLIVVRDLLKTLLHPSGHLDAGVTEDIDKNVIDLAALVFGVQPKSLSLSSTPETVDGWDSFRHVNLMLQAEDMFDVRISGNLLPTIKSLQDLSALIQRLKA